MPSEYASSLKSTSAKLLTADHDDEGPSTFDDDDEGPPTFDAPPTFKPVNQDLHGVEAKTRFDIVRRVQTAGFGISDMMAVDDEEEAGLYHQLKQMGEQVQQVRSELQRERERATRAEEALGQVAEDSLQAELEVKSLQFQLRNMEAVARAGMGTVLGISRRLEDLCRGRAAPQQVCQDTVSLGLPQSLTLCQAVLTVLEGEWLQERAVPQLGVVAEVSAEQFDAFANSSEELEAAMSSLRSRTRPRLSSVPDELGSMATQVGGAATIDSGAAVGGEKLAKKVAWSASVLSDSEAPSICGICATPLGMRRLRRRHQCWSCRLLVCSTCSPSFVKFDGQNVLQRTCAHCVDFIPRAPRP